MLLPVKQQRTYLDVGGAQRKPAEIRKSADRADELLARPRDVCADLEGRQRDLGQLKRGGHGVEEDWGWRMGEVLGMGVVHRPPGDELLNDRWGGVEGLEIREQAGREWHWCGTGGGERDAGDSRMLLQEGDPQLEI